MLLGWGRSRSGCAGFSGMGMMEDNLNDLIELASIAIMFMIVLIVLKILG